MKSTPGLNSSLLIFQTLKSCASGDAPIPIYHDFAAGEIVAFMKGLLI
jgi:hypothetical protein